MKIKLIDYGMKHLPSRAHYNDAGADVYANIDSPTEIWAGESKKIPLGFGLELPDGIAAFVFPRSSLSSSGVSCELPPIDSGYRGEIHAIVTNHGGRPFIVDSGYRIGQLVILPIILADFIKDFGEERGINCFGSTGID